jgi:hypothetical protein
MPAPRQVQVPVLVLLQALVPLLVLAQPLRLLPRLAQLLAQLLVQPLRTTGGPPLVGPLTWVATLTLMASGVGSLMLVRRGVS